jgi:hypothetical protein
MNDDEEDESATVLFIPEDPTILKSLFDVFSSCSSLNPDIVDDEEEAELFTKEYFE